MDGRVGSNIMVERGGGGRGGGTGRGEGEGGETQENSVMFLRHPGKAIIDIWGV